MTFQSWVPILIFAAAGFANAEQSNPSGRVDQEKSLVSRLQEYVKMQQDLEASGSPAAGNSADAAQIAARQHALAGRIAATRRGARQGEIFTEDVAEQFEKIIRKAFKEPGGQAMRKTIQERDPVRRIVLKVNDVYPDDQPRTTMPPTLLNRLPILPKELAYRIIGRALVLQDTKTNLIVDFIPNAIPLK